MFISLAKGQEDLKALILKEKKKKKKDVDILNMGRRFGERLKRPTDLTSSSKEGRTKKERRTLALQSLIMILIKTMSNILLLRIDTESYRIF